MIRCHHCGAETSNGLALCELCQQFARSCFEFLPVYFRNLARWRPGRTGSRPVPGSRVLYDGADVGTGTGDRISDTLDETTTELMTWARVLVDARTFPRPLTEADAVLSDDLAGEYAADLSDHPERVATLICRGFDEHLSSIATTDWCGEFVREVSRHEARLRKLTEVAVPGWYAGSCQRVVARGADGTDLHCGSSTYVVPGLTWVTCATCGTTTHVQAHLEVVLDEARDWIARPKELARALVALVDTEPSVPRLYDRIRRWATDGALQPIRRTERGYAWDEGIKRAVLVEQEVGHARYRLGDVLDLTVRRVTRAERISQNAAAAS